MNTFVLLLRGVNVGGNNSLPMKDLARLLESLGAQGVKTYIQSGNAVFQMAAKAAEALPAGIAAAIQRDFGFAPGVVLLPLQACEQAMANNPFQQAQEQPSTLHLGFLAQLPKAATSAKLHEVKSDSEQFAVIDKVFYLHAPDGIGRSKLASRAEKILGVDMTLRNWRTVSALYQLKE